MKVSSTVLRGEWGREAPDLPDREEGMIIMARSTICNIGTRMVSVDDAIEMRDNARSRGLDYPDFRCPECGASVRPHRAGSGACAHFEHLSRNPNCRLSDPAR